MYILIDDFLNCFVFVFQVSNADFDDDEDRDLCTARAKSALETLQMGVAREGVRVCFWVAVHLPSHECMVLSRADGCTCSLSLSIPHPAGVFKCVSATYISVPEGQLWQVVPHARLSV